MKIKLIGCTAAVLSILCFEYVEAGALKNKISKEEHPKIGNDKEEVGKESTEKKEQANEESAPAIADGTAKEEANLSKKDNESKSEKKISGNPIVLKIGNKVFTRNDILADMKMIPPQMIQGISHENLFKMLLEQRMRTYLIVEYAKSIGLESSKEFRDEHEKAKEGILAKLLLITKIAPKASESALKARYTKYLVEFKKVKEYHILHIMLSTEQAAKDVIAALAKGEDFAKLAKEKSEAQSKENGGDEGFIPATVLPAPIAEKITALKAGEYTKEFIKTENGYHIFKVVEIQDSSPQKFEEAKDMLKQMIMHESMISLVEELEKKSKIEMFNEDGTPLKKASNAKENATKEKNTK